MMLLGRKRPFQSSSITQTPIIDSKKQLNQQRANEIMDLFMQQTELTPVENDLPLPKLKQDADMSPYKTSLLSKYSEDIQLIWTLAIAFTKQDQAASVKKWISDLVKPGLESQLQITLNIHGDDPFVQTFINLAFGQHDAASESAQKLNDFNLAMYIIHSEYKDTNGIVQQQIKDFKSNGQWQSMTEFHKKCWHTVAGNLGYVPEDNIIITDGIYWQCVLGMYIWFGNDYGYFDLEKYNKALDTTNPNIKQIKTTNNTAYPDNRCYWYQLLQWWIGNQNVAKIDEWPADLVWLLSIFKQPNNIDEKYALNWIEYLETQDMAESAIYATLFLPRNKEKLSYILRQCEWSNEAKLINSFHIPKKQVSIAKALNAHDSWDYEAEYNCLIEGGLAEQAKMALFHFLLPKTYNDDENSVQSSLNFLAKFPNPDSEINTLTNTYQMILTKERANNAGQYINELDALLSKYTSKCLNDLLNDLKESLMDSSQ